MPLCRPKRDHADERNLSRFNTYGLGEILTGDDSAFVRDYEVFIPDIGWMELGEALRLHEVITNNHNTDFMLPPTEADRARGFTLY